jgi:hypothetical protein
MVLLWSLPATAARNFQLRGDNELCGGIGVAGDITDFTPGGFKWFNDYSRRLTDLTWLNFQLNVTIGGDRGDRDCRVVNGVVVCDDYHWDHWGGDALELAVGVKLKWRLQQIPLVLHAKFGGAVDVIFFPGDLEGVALGFRGGFGVRYFFLPTFGVGAEIVPTFGPGFFEDPVGVEPYAAIDVNTGVEWRF